LGKTSWEVGEVQGEVLIPQSRNQSGDWRSSKVGAAGKAVLTTDKHGLPAVGVDEHRCWGVGNCKNKIIEQFKF